MLVAGSVPTLETPPQTPCLTVQISNLNKNQTLNWIEIKYNNVTTTRRIEQWSKNDMINSQL
jgi:hypothetical protein